MGPDEGFIADAASNLGMILRRLRVAAFRLGTLGPAGVSGQPSAPGDGG